MKQLAAALAAILCLAHPSLGLGWTDYEMRLPDGWVIVRANSDQMGILAPMGEVGSLINNELGWHGAFDCVSITSTHVLLRHPDTSGREYAVITRGTRSFGVGRDSWLQGPMTRAEFNALGIKPKKWIIVRHPWHWISKVFLLVCALAIAPWWLKRLFTSTPPVAASCDQTS